MTRSDTFRENAPDSVKASGSSCISRIESGVAPMDAIMALGTKRAKSILKTGRPWSGLEDIVTDKAKVQLQVAQVPKDVVGPTMRGGAFYAEIA